MGNTEWNTYSITILIPYFESFVFNLFSEIVSIIFSNQSKFTIMFLKNATAKLWCAATSLLLVVNQYCTSGLYIIIIAWRQRHQWLGSYHSDVPSVECSYKLRRFHRSNRNFTVAHTVGIWVETFFVAVWRIKLCRIGVKILPLYS